MMHNPEHETGDDSHVHRQLMTDKQIRSRGLRDERVIEAMLSLPRDQFVPESIRSDAYEDRALPIACGQTISQPYIVAYMTEQLTVTPSCRVLEIGTGTGYQTAILARLSRHVYTIERLCELHRQASVTLSSLSIENVTLFEADGSLGLPQHAPFDRILVTAAAPKIPQTLVDQLAENGRMVIPVGGKSEQTIYCVDRHEGKIVKTKGIDCRFVKLMGNQGWPIDAD